MNLLFQNTYKSSDYRIPFQNDILYLLIFLMGVSVCGQSPGGVSGASLWLRADQGVGNTTYINVSASNRTASSTNSAVLSPANSVLSSTTSWSAQSTVNGDYLTLDTGSVQTLRGIVTKGRADYAQWVTSYTVSYSTDDITYTVINVSGTPISFRGNFDQNTEIINQFPAPVNARYIRITVTAFNGHPSMRADVLQSIGSVTVDNSSLSVWQDQSGRNNSTFQSNALGSATVRPVFKDNATDNINFNPVVNFGATQQLIDGSGVVPTINNTGASAFVMSAVTSVTNSTVFSEPLGVGNSYNMYLPWAADGLVYWDGANSSRISAPWGGVTGQPYLWTGWNNSTLTPKTTIRRNGMQIASGVTQNIYTGNNSPMYIGGAYVGRIGDLIIYNRDLSADERSRVESYVAIKYGLTLDQTSIQNYLNSSSAMVWDAATNIPYNNNIAGIGRDDTSGLLQKQSRSINSGIQPIIGNVTIAASNALNTNSFSSNMGYLLWGSDTGSTNLFSSSFNYGGLTGRMARVWRVQETGNVGTVKVALAVNQLPASLSQPALVISGDTTFDGSDTRVLMTLETIGGIDYYSGTVDFTTGQYFTFAGTLSAPGGVVSGLSGWYKENASNTATVWKNATGYEDASGTGVNVYNTSGKDMVNFNPAYAFNTSGVFTLPASLDLSGNYSQFGVARLKTAGASARVFGSALSNVILGYWGNLMNTVYYDTAPNSLTSGANGVVPSTTDIRQYSYIRNNGPFAFYGNGASLLTGSISGTTPLRGTIGGSSGENSNVVVPEYITYSTNLSTADQNKVETYLAVKYGHTKAGNYTNSAGTVIWTSGTGYDNNIASIARDDASALNQKQSQSMNTGLQPVIGNNSITDTNVGNTNNFTTDVSSLVWGSDTGSTFFTTSFAFGTSTYRMDRIWKVQETGTVGTVKVAVPVNQISGIRDLSLVVSNDVVFDDSDNRIAMIQENLGGVQYYTATIDFTTGQFYTFSGAVIGPGGVSGAGVWLRADAGSVTGTTNYNVPAGSRTASTTNNPTLSPANSTLSSGSSWSALTAITGDYLTLDLGSSQTVNGVVTKGRGDAAQWVTSYTLSYSTDGTNYTDMGRTYRANTDQNSEISNIFTTPITARYIRFTVTGFYGHPSMRADVIQSVTVAADTNAIANWTDQSGSNNNAMQTVISGRPTYRNNATDNLNFNPVANFNGSQNMYDQDGIFGTNTYTDVAAFVANATTTATNSSAFAEALGTGVYMDMHTPWSDGIVYWDGPQSSRIQAAWGGTVGTPYLWTGWNNNNLTPKTSLRRNGLQIASGAAMAAYTGNNSPMYFGAYPGQASYIGRMGDIIVLNRAISAIERNRVESYMAIKYGLTLDQTTAQNYTNSASAVVWNASQNSGFGNNIAGIMRDDASVLNQKQSKSSNAGFQPIIGNIGIADTNTANTNAFTANFSSLVWGSDTGSLSFVTPFAFGNSSHRMTRIWKVQKTGTVDNVKVAIPLDQLAGNVSRPYLVISNDNLFDSTDTRTEMTLETIAGIQYYTATTNFTSGQFYTFSALETAPGGVNAGLVSWNKQNPNNTTTIWKNALNTNDATGGGSIVYNTTNTTSDLVNFNESYTLNGGVFTLPAALDVSGNYSMFGVSRLKVPGSNGRVFGSSLSNVILGYWNNLMNTIYYDNNPASLTVGTNSVVASTTDIRQYTYIRNGGPFSFYGNSFSILSGASSGATAFRGTIGGSSGENSYVVSPEYITYNTALSATDQNKVESYLALKYGYTKSGNYIGSTGTTFWTATAGYNSNVAGIGRDDNSGLEQKVSKSVSQGAILTLSTNADFINSNSASSRTGIINNLNFLTVGDDNGSTVTRINTDLMPGFTTRIAREWRVQNTGFTQDIHLQFSLLDYSIRWNVIWDADGDFTAGAVNLGLLNTQAQGNFAGTQLGTGYFALMATPTDSDGDGLIDADDLDDDNDGILDMVECPNQFFWAGPITFSPDNKVATGNINGIGFTFTSDKAMSSTPSVFQYNVFPASYGIPNNNPTIRNNEISGNVLTFDQPMADPILVLASLGGVPTVPVIFDRPIEILWSTCTGSPCSFTQNSPTQITGQEAYVIVKVPGVHSSLSFNYTVAESYVNFVFGASKLGVCDTDSDGIPNGLDLDSDNDGCVDAVEGDENVNPNQLVTSAGTVTSGPGSSAPNKNICASTSCIDSQGVPLLVNTGGAADIGNDQGQGIGTSQDATSQPANCISLSCYKPAVTAGITLNTDFGISALGRAGTNNDNWPMVRKGAWTALEAKTKGFVVNRVAFDASGNPVGIPPANFIEGMMVYDTTNNCLKVYTTTDNGTTYGWSCMTTQTCPD